MEADLIAYLLADAGLVAVFGANMKWHTRPRGSGLPALVLQVVSTPRVQTFDGRDRLVGALVQMDIWGSTYASVLAGRNALLIALDGLTVGDFQGGFPETERDGFEPGDVPQAGGAPTDLHRASLDVRVWHRSAT